MPKKWRIRSLDAGEIQSYQSATGLPALVAQLLICRGIPTSEAANFLDPRLTDLIPPDELPGVPQAAERIAAAVAQRQRIVVYGDYDADGISATAILVRCLRLLDADVHYHIPNRLDEGYGLNQKALQKIADANTSLVVTVDCGIASVAEAQFARGLGLQLIITDHHCPADELPDAEAIVHPGLPGSRYPFAGLCGAGVAFKLAWAICQHVCGSRRVTAPLKEFLLQAIGLAAVGTVADVVPLVDENRILVHHGLHSLRQRPPVGCAQLMQQAGIFDKPALTSEDIAFSLAPRLNAAGRLGQASLAAELLITEDQRRASSLAEYLGELNKSRESLERSVYKAARQQALDAIDAGHGTAFVLADHGWHAGVIGIVAGRLADKFHRPVLLVALDQAASKPGMGSGRAIPGFNLVEGLASCQELLISHGGHAAAAGFKVAENNLESLRTAFCQYAAENLAEQDLQAELKIDGEIPFAALTMQAVEHLERLAPFGQANPRPLLCTTDVELAAPPKTIGGGDRHLALQLAQHAVRIRGVAFGQGEYADQLSQREGTLSFAYRPVINTFRNRRSVEIHVVDWQSASAAAPGTNEGTGQFSRR
ncbi:MAG: single-stranded-DNA-specific exonuclease RecJ [Planctomycetales bacterium]|nr:single-stranded-DNA-specific exonuclease RecJ [Planctomycetales bacterium]NIM10334.1 single-stranded-DNA-specific exonuclease RecJ [Planctomycetales bacterium]NIN09755.1 single-stranded-DNA-specific exonuclease RecJ [Planctomycetales bacterium]NIN78878.1 single-stranded-DNA-specific exonuclease RecJ [Planctomycetales bacterium]NIO36049.1 single-stranded-DNA-specific exonuclease RecJ [Planctomycetales bacterium]